MDRVSIIRLETRAREFTDVARIRQQAVNKGKPTSPQPSGEGRGVKAPEVTAVTRESSRSWRGQGEAGRKLGGGPIGL